MNTYYLLVWMEDSACWWQADECMESSSTEPWRCSAAVIRGNAAPVAPGQS